MSGTKEKNFWGKGRGRRYTKGYREAAVKAAREGDRKGVSRAEVARRLGVSGQTLANWIITADKEAVLRRRALKRAA